jgi:CHAD domain-containing protein
MPNHVGKLLLDALDNHWDRYRKRLKTCRHDISEDAVHELRIATRRLLSLIELINTLAPQRPLNKLRKLLKSQLDGFDELRDTQVMLLEIGNTVSILPELTPFLQHLEQREQRLLLQTEAFIETLTIGKLKRKLKKARGRCKRPLGQYDANVAVLAAIDKVYAIAFSRYQAIDPEQLSSIHHLRIAVKKLRYMLTSVQAMIPGLPDDHQKQLQTYLTRMGDIQNSAVLLQMLDAFFPDGIPQTILRHFQQQQNDLIAAFMAHREEIFGFWRKNSAQDLPWATGNTAF